jgi:hypothetical protein
MKDFKHLLMIIAGITLIGDNNILDSKIAMVGCVLILAAAYSIISDQAKAEENKKNNK